VLGFVKSEAFFQDSVACRAARRAILSTVGFRQRSLVLTARMDLLEVANYEFGGNAPTTGNLRVHYATYWLLVLFTGVHHITTHQYIIAKAFEFCP